MRKTVLFGTMFLVLAAGLWGQNFANSRDPFYSHVQRWEVKGYLSPLPPMMPYPLQHIETILAEVQASSAPSWEKAIAQGYQERINESVEIRFGGFGEGRLNSQDNYVAGGLALEYNGYFSPEISLSGRWTGFALDHSEGDFLPTYKKASYDVFSDNADLTIAGRELDLRQEFFNNMALVGENYYFQAGIMPLALGTELGSPTLSGEQFIAPSVNFQYDIGWVRTGLTYMALTATDYFGNGAFGDKHLVMHNYTLQPLEWLRLSAYEVSVWGGRFDLVNFIPFTFMFYNGSFTGFKDNAAIAGVMEVFLPHNLFWNTELSIDDASLNKLLRLQFADMKLKVAARSHLNWYPQWDFLRKVHLGYLAITPYTYSHHSDRFLGRESQHEHLDELYDDPPGTGPDNYAKTTLTQPNYQIYAHYGRSLGSQLNPNSDQISLQSQWNLLPGLGLGVDSRFIRHGNPNDNIKGTDYANNFPDDFDYAPWVIDPELAGTIYDDGFTDEYYETFQFDNRFLTQETLEMRLSTDLQLQYAFFLERWLINVSAGAFVEMIWNERFVSGSDRLRAFGYGTFGALYVF